MSLKSKIEAVIYASEEPVTLQQLTGLLAGEAQVELEVQASLQAQLQLETMGDQTASSQPSVLQAGVDEMHVPELAAAGASTQAHVVDEGLIVQANVDPAAHSPWVEEGESERRRVTPDEASSDTPSERPAQLGTATSADSGGNDTPEEDKRGQRERERAIREHIRRAVYELIRDYSQSDRGIEIREVASGFRMGTKPEYHDAVRGFVKSLKPALKLTLPALETLAVVAYKQPVTAAEISEIRGVDSAGVLGGLMTRKLIATAGRKQVIGRPMLYKTTRDFLLRFGLKDVNELPSMEEFERMAGELAEQDDLPMENTSSLIEQANARGDAEHIRDATAFDVESDSSQDHTENAAESVTSDDLQRDSTPHEATAEIAAGGTDESSHTEENATEDAEALAEQPA